MGDMTAEFFADLEANRHQPLLQKATGSLGFELTDGKTVERWRVDLHDGDVAVSHNVDDADCVLYAPKGLFDNLVAGRQHAMAAVLRGAATVDGDIELLMVFQRILPSPSGSPDTA